MSLLNPTVNRLAWRQTKSQWRRADWRALLASVFLMTTLITLLSLTGDRLQGSLVQRSAEVLGADLILSSSRPITDEERALWQSNDQVRATEVTQFTTVVEGGDQILLSSIRAVTNPYPMRGEIITRDPAKNALPEPGHIWVEASVLERLGVNVGDTVHIGYAPLVIDQIIESSPDRGSGFRSFNPQVIMRLEDLPATQVITDGSRVRYRVLFAGEIEPIQSLEANLKPELPSWQRVFTAHGDQPVSRNAIGNAGQYLKLSALFALLLGAMAIFLSLRRLSADQQHRIALLLSLGLSRSQLRQLLGTQLLFGWALAAIPGTILGVVLHAAVMALLGDLLPKPLPDIHYGMLISSPLLALVMLVLLGLPTLLPLSQISIMALLRQNTQQKLSASKWVNLITPVLLYALLVLFIESWWMAALMTVALLLMGYLAGLAVQALIQGLSKPLAKRLRLASLLTLRIRQQRHWHRIQGAVLTLLLTLMTVLLFARQDLLNDWENQLPADTPNHFVINIQSWERDAVADWFDQNQIDTTLYPMIRGRLTSKNDLPIEQAFTPEQQKHNALNRELNLSFASEKPAHNPIVEGEWQSDGDSISLEQEMAQELGLTLGDTLTFTVGSDTFTGTVTSIRTVEWTSFRPNFYVIFTPGVLDQLPATYITSFRLSEAEKPKATALVKAFPTLTMIDVDQLLKQAEELIQKLSDSASFIMGLTVLCGLILVIATLQQDLAKRQFETALLRTLGATSEQTKRLNHLEYILMGFSCGVLAAILSELVLLGIYLGPLELEPTLHPNLWILLPVVGTLLFTLTGSLIRKGMDVQQSFAYLKQRED